jgi:hypothetical protein
MLNVGCRHIITGAANLNQPCPAKNQTILGAIISTRLHRRMSEFIEAFAPSKSIVV